MKTLNRILLLVALLLLPMLSHAFPFETTPSPNTYPIHWYQLKCNGYYVYSQGGFVRANRTASTDDSYLWCFVASSSGKVLIYNKYNHGYMCGEDRMVTDPNESDIKFVESGSGQNFYICFYYGGLKWYQDYVEGESCCYTNKGNPFTVVEALVEDEIAPSGELIFLDLAVCETSCKVSAVYTGWEECVVNIIHNGTRVGSQYSLSRSEEDRTEHLEAVVEFNQPGINAVTIAQDFTIPALEVAKPSDVALTALDAYTPNNEIDNYGDEGFAKLFDKDKSTKWCVENRSGAWQPIWVDFKAEVPFIPTSYTLTTGNDTHSFFTRNPDSWKIYGKAKEDDEWTTLVTVSSGYQAGLGTANSTDYTFVIEGVAKAYQYFRFEVDAVLGNDRWNTAYYIFQLAELAMEGITELPPAPQVRGDLNADGRVDVDDLNVVINRILGKDDLADVGDINGDGGVDVDDMNIIINIILGKDTGEKPVTQTYTVNGVSFKMVDVKGGTFTMGGYGGDESVQSDEKPVHQVTLSNFAIGETEVTQELWVAVMGRNPSTVSSRNGYTENLQRPVESVSWVACQQFITQLNALTGQTFRLPTESEWEYAARGGMNNQGYKYAGSNDLNEVAWYRDNVPSLTWGTEGYGPQTVATKVPNELGVYDMSGNVSEWCQDWYGNYSSEAQTDPTGPETGSVRVARGGGYNQYDTYCRVLRRLPYQPDSGYGNVGLRLAM